MFKAVGIITVMLSLTSIGIAHADAVVAQSTPNDANSPKQRLQAPTPALAVSVPYAGYEGGTKYDPSKCSRDPHGMVYFAIGRSVFRQPKDAVIEVKGGSPDLFAGLPKPPNPDEPAGCPDHPLQGPGFILSKVSKVSPVGEEDKSKAPESGATLIYDPSGENYGTQPSDAKLFKQAADICTQLPSGLEECWGTGSMSSLHSVVIVEAPPAVYKTPDGKYPFVVSCMPPFSVIPKDYYGCNIVYKLEPHVNLLYGFTTNITPLDSALDVDRMMRKFILSAEVQGYQWPDVAP